ITSQGDFVVDGVVAAQLTAEARIRNGTQKAPIRDSKIHQREAALARHLKRIARIVGKYRLGQHFGSTIDALLMREEPEDRRNTVENAMLDSHPARTKAQRELKVLGEIQPQNSEAVELVGRVVGLIAEPRIVADAEESLGGIFLEIEASLERP